jgi:hypothetical protein
MSAHHKSTDGPLEQHAFVPLESKVSTESFRSVQLVVHRCRRNFAQWVRPTFDGFCGTNPPKSTSEQRRYTKELYMAG